MAASSIGDKQVPVERRILVVEDDVEIRILLRRVLESDDYQVEEACDGARALEAIRRHRFPVVIIDIVMPKMSGLELLREVKSLPFHTEVVLITGHADVETAAKALELGAFAYLTKPFKGLTQVTNTVESAFERVKLRWLIDYLTERLIRRNQELEEVVDGVQEIVDGALGGVVGAKEDKEKALAQLVALRDRIEELERENRRLTEGEP